MMNPCGRRYGRKPPSADALAIGAWMSCWDGWMASFEIAARITRDGRYAWAAQRLMDYFLASGYRAAIGAAPCSTRCSDGARNASRSASATGPARVVGAAA
mgnify:CR=1 FL=1